MDTSILLNYPFLNIIIGKSIDLLDINILFDYTCTNQSI